MPENKQRNLEKELENHLRSTARKMLKFDTEEEVLQYLTESFQARLDCDFVGVFILDEEYVTPKVWVGELEAIKDSFPIHIEKFSSNLFNRSLKYDDEDVPESDPFIRLIDKENIEAWFTLPIKDETKTYGFCTVGFKDFTLLFEMNEAFDEFGKDVATAMSLAKRKEIDQKKMMEMKWIVNNLSLDESMGGLVGNIVELAAKQTRARFVGVYLYDDSVKKFFLQRPFYGDIHMPEEIMTEDTLLKNYFPYLEIAGGDQLTIPIILDFKTIGVLHVEGVSGESFDETDLNVVKLYVNHITSVLENALLSKKDRDQNERMRNLLDFQKELVQETVEENNFDGITLKLSKLFSKSVILFDRFWRPITHSFSSGRLDLEKISTTASEEMNRRSIKNVNINLRLDENTEISIWPVNGGGDLMGYLAMESYETYMDSLDLLTLELAQNIYSIQFIKQKLVLNTREQVKDSFIDKLLVENIEDKEDIVEYANLFGWNPFQEHRVSAVSLQLNEPNPDILLLKTRTSLILEHLKSIISTYDERIIMANIKDMLILIVPIRNDLDKKKYWAEFYQKVTLDLEREELDCRITIGVGGKAETLEEYYNAYLKAAETVNVLSNQNIQLNYAFFEDLGSYTLLHHLKNTPKATLFMSSYLEEIIKHSKGRMDLFHTLRVYLEQNGNVQRTAEEIFIHRSSLLYRLEKIEEIIGYDLTNAELRFNLMLAYKLYDMYGNLE